MEATDKELSCITGTETGRKWLLATGSLVFERINVPWYFIFFNSIVLLRFNSTYLPLESSL